MPKKVKDDLRYTAVRCLDTGEVFNSIGEAAAAKKLDRSGISAVCARRIKSTMGTHWEYVGLSSYERKKEQKKKPKKPKGAINAKPVQCIDTGEVFSSMTAAAVSKGITLYAISRACRGVQKKAFGLRWKYVDGDDPRIEKNKNCVNNPYASMPWNELVRCMKAEGLQYGQFAQKYGL